MNRRYQQKALVQIKSIGKLVYSIISIISTLAVFSAVLLYAFGKIGGGALSDDALIMKNIREQMPENLGINSIHMEDIHGFGNESMIVLASDDVGDKTNNQLLIFDTVNNSILQKINYLFGYGSNYKMVYSFSLDDPRLDTKFSMGYYLEIIDIIDLTGDLSKEIVVKFMPVPPGTSGYYEVAIFTYSYENQGYMLLGTYPSAGLYDLDEHRTNIYAGSVFHDSTACLSNLYGSEPLFNLEWSTMDDHDFFTSNYSVYLIRTKMIWGEDESHVDPHQHIISVFQPWYNDESGELMWRVVFSDIMTEKVPYCSREIVAAFLEEKGVSWIME